MLKYNAIRDDKVVTIAYSKKYPKKPTSVGKVACAVEMPD